jgi:predicted nucleic acid-binding protein
VIYVDSSVALAYLLAESRAPTVDFLEAPLVSSRLLEYEVWTRMHARQPSPSLTSETRGLLAGIELIEMTELVLARALRPFPIAIRTLDALHLATMDYLRSRGTDVELASYDTRLLEAAHALGIPAADL